MMLPRYAERCDGSKHGRLKSELFVGNGLMFQKPFDSWESSLVVTWKIDNLQHERDMTVTGRDRRDPRKAILSVFFYVNPKLSIAFGRLGYIHM